MSSNLLIVRVCARNWGRGGGGRHQPIYYSNKLCEWLVIDKRQYKLIESGFLKNEYQTMITFVSLQSQILIILDWYIYPNWDISWTNSPCTPTPSVPEL